MYFFGTPGIYYQKGIFLMFQSSRCLLPIEHGQLQILTQAASMSATEVLPVSV